MRVDPATIQVPEGQPFPGALPPGPAPEQGDWFTRLQERFEDALQDLPEEERKVWTRPIELPPYIPPDESGAAAAVPNVAVPSAAGPGGAEPTVVTRLESRNASFLEYDGPQPRQWVEVDEQGAVKYTFEELRRTDRLVTIIDRKRNMTVRLPLGGGRVLFSTDGEEKWSALGNFHVPQAQEELANEENDPMAAGNMAAGGVAGNANPPANPPVARPDRIDRVQLPKGMRDILKLPGMSEKMDRLERVYLLNKGGFFIYGRVIPQNPQVDARLIEARMPVGPGGHFIDLVADAGRPVGFVLQGHAYLSVVPTGPPNGHGSGPHSSDH